MSILENFKKILRRSAVFVVIYLAVKWLIIVLFGGYLYNNGILKGNYLAFIPLAVMIFGGLIFFGKKKNNARSYFIKSIRTQYRPDFSDIEKKFDEEFKKISPDIVFVKSSKNPMDRRIVVAAYFLALIKTLETKNVSMEVIRKMCLEIAGEYVRPKTPIHAALKKLPAKMISWRLTNFLLEFYDLKVRNEIHPDGFALKIVTDRDQTWGLGYGVDILECGICKLFTKHGMQKYAPILCEIDFITTNLAGLQLLRSGTIANGAAKCDFRFKPLGQP